MTIKEIVLEPTEESRRKAIQENLGQEVILKDEHYGWCHGVLLREGYDNEVYLIEVVGRRRKGSQRREEIPRHYDDLNQLLVISK